MIGRPPPPIVPGPHAHALVVRVGGHAARECPGVFDAGQVPTRTLTEYGLLGTDEVPSIDVAGQGRRRPSNPLGVTARGEGPIGPAAAECGAEIDELPVMAERIAGFTRSCPTIAPGFQARNLSTEDPSMKERMVRRVSRRTFLRTATGAAALLTGVAGPHRSAWGADPIVIGHQCDLTGLLSEIGYWHDKSARAAIDRFNKEGGIAGRPVTYVAEDSETSPAVGVRKLRKLIQENKADFVIGSEHGGLAMASAPIVKETKTLYVSASYTDAVTGKAGNRYVIRLTNTTRHGARGVAGWAVSNLGKRWGIIFPDYAFGHAHRDNWTAEVERAGGSVLSKIAIPVGTQDPMAYVVNLASGCEAVYVTMNPPDQPRVQTALKEIGFKGQRLISPGGVDSFDPLQIPEVTVGTWGTSMMPYELSFRDTPHLRHLRDTLGIDANARERGTGRLAVIGESWIAWEALHLIKLAAEKSGWKQKKDTPKLIEYLESVNRLPESREFPQGELLFRGEDHQAFMDYYLHKIEAKGIRVVQRLPKEGTVYPAVVDYRKEAWG